jgi:hypothetical protein
VHDRQSTYLTKLGEKKKEKRKRKRKPLKYGRCRKSGDCPQEDLAKSGYKSQLNYKSLCFFYPWNSPFVGIFF